MTNRLPPHFALFLLVIAQAAFSFPQPDSTDHRGHTPALLQTNSLWQFADGMQASLAVEARSDWQTPLLGLEGSLWRFGVLRMDFAVSPNVQMQIRGAVRQRFHFDRDPNLSEDSQPAFETTTDAGDFSIATIARIIEDRNRTTAFGFRVEVKLPNTTQQKGIGPNTTDVFMTLLLSRRIGSALVLADVGIGILTAPREVDEQNDVLSYGLAIIRKAGKRIHLGAEINGYLTTRNIIPVGTEARGQARLGASFALRIFTIEMAALRGLTLNEGGWGGALGLSRQIDF